MAIKPIQDTKALTQDSRVTKEDIRKVYHVTTQEIKAELQSDNYILEKGILYVFAPDDVILGDGKNTYSNSPKLGVDLGEISDTYLTKEEYTAYLINDAELTEEQTSATINAKYPNAKVRTILVAPNIGSGMMFLKVSNSGSDTWFSWAGQII